jgi:hypothetical protein
MLDCDQFLGVGGQPQGSGKLNLNPTSLNKPNTSALGLGEGTSSTETALVSQIWSLPAKISASLPRPHSYTFRRLPHQS